MTKLPCNIPLINFWKLCYLIWMKAFRIFKNVQYCAKLQYIYCFENLIISIHIYYKVIWYNKQTKNWKLTHYQSEQKYPEWIHLQSYNIDHSTECESTHISLDPIKCLFQDILSIPSPHLRYIIMLYITLTHISSSKHHTWSTSLLPFK